ncbi:hypothetical protein [uncultured Parasutterella sp.]|jgi:hypothetical protein|uniref:hypothetical protein n=1 Tax=uncultured Parasutterella sp. TaxID=1263098 RepID=UPI0025FB2D78|nr:hypothetical protein [uncultured Parasutterella sp.]
MEIKALLAASVLAGQFGLCYASSDGDLIAGIIPEPDSISVTSVVIEPFHPDFEKHSAGLTAGKTPVCLKITRVREADGVSWVTQTTVNPLSQKRLAGERQQRRLAAESICSIRTDECD